LFASLVLSIAAATKKKRKEEAYSWKAGPSRGHITNLKQSILEPFAIYGFNAGIIAPYLLTLANRNHPIYVCTIQGSQGQYSQVMLPSAVTSSFANKCRQCK
jgi:hypothetical protein